MAKNHAKRLKEVINVRANDSNIFKNSITDKFLLATTFVSGMSIMAIEMSASRLLAPYFGTSLFVWTNIIGIIMAALSIGYYFGGKLADKYQSKTLFYSIILGCGLYFCIIPFIAKYIMAYSVVALNTASIGLFFSSLFATIILFALPLGFLGMISPYAIRLSAKSLEKTGFTAGSIYSLSTAGSIVGTFIPTLLTIPFIGTKNTILLFSGALILFGLIGLKRKLFSFLILLPILLLVFSYHSSIRAEKDIVYEGESVYNYIQVLYEDDVYSLKLNEGHATHSKYNPNNIQSGGIWTFFLALPLIKDDINNTLIVGLAAGSISKQYLYYFPDMKIDGVEIDPKIVEVGRKYFDMNEKNLDVYVEDGRIFLFRTDAKYDLIITDAYKQPYIPFHLATREYFELVKMHLNPGGIAAINVGTTSEDSKVLSMITNTVALVYDHVYMVQVPGYLNYIVYASDTDFNPNMILDSKQKGLDKVKLDFLYNPKKVIFDPNKLVLTDDKAPVEVYTDLMILKYAQNV